MVIQRTTSARIDNHHALLMALGKYVVRDAEDAREITSGSLSDLPNIDQGTAIWSNWEEFQEPNDIGDVGAGTSMVSPKVKAHHLMQVETISLDRQMAQLKHAADAGDERTFLRAESSIDWENRSAEDVLRGIRFALAAGAHQAAQRIASRGVTLYPDHSEIKKFAHVLAPPKILKKEGFPRSDLRANRDWLKSHRNEYQGQWVALHDGELMGYSQTLAELRKKVVGDEKMFFIRVY